MHLRKLLALGVVLFLSAVAGYVVLNQDFVSSQNATDDGLDARSDRINDAPSAPNQRKGRDSIDNEISNVELSARRRQVYDPPDFTIHRFDDYNSLGASWATTYEENKTDALNGDPSAQFAIYQSSFKCFHAPKTKEDFDARQEDVSLPYYDSLGNYVENDDGSDKRLNSLAAAFDFCRDSNHDMVADFPDWLEKAADSDFLPAMLRYGIDYPGDDGLDPRHSADAEEIERRSQKYKEYVDRAAELGSMDARSQQLGFLAQLDRTADEQVEFVAILYALAWFYYERDSNDNLFKHLDAEGSLLTPHTHSEALTRGREILLSQNCCVYLPN